MGLHGGVQGSSGRSLVGAKGLSDQSDLCCKAGMLDWMQASPKGTPKVDGHGVNAD